MAWAIPARRAPALWTARPLTLSLPPPHATHAHTPRQGGDEFPTWIAYLSQVFTFGGGLLGISYGILSTSWDPTREGSFWGLTEFRANLPIVLAARGNRDGEGR